MASKRSRVARDDATAKALEDKVFGRDLFAASTPKSRTQQKEKKAPINAAVWEDEDDSNFRVDLDGTDRLKKLKSTAKTSVVSGSELTVLLKERFQSREVGWATRYEEKDIKFDQDSSDFSLLAQSGSLIDSTDGKGILAPGKVDIKRCIDANSSSPPSGKETISVTKFHKSGSLLMVGSTDKYLRFYRVNGEKNELECAVKFNDMVIQSADFVGPDLNQVVVSGRKPFFYSYDMVSGKSMRVPCLLGKGIKSHEIMTVSPKGSKIAVGGISGYIHIVCGLKKTHITDIKMNTAVRSLAFVDELTLVTSGLDAEVYIWDLRYAGQGKCLGKFAHDDGTCTSTISVHRSASNSYLAVGAESGVVSIYDATTSYLTGVKALPIKMKSIMNLSFKITNLCFHPSGQMLAMSSDQKRDELRLVHTKSCTVFSNWPTDRSPFRRVTSFDFSPGGGYFAVGNNVGKVLLYRVSQFSDA